MWTCNWLTSLNLRGKLSLQVSENKVPGIIFRPIRDEVMGQFKTLHSIFGGGGIFSVRYRGQTGSGAHLPSYGYRRLIFGDKAAEA